MPLTFRSGSQTKSDARASGSTASRPARPPEWLIELGLNRHAASVYVHVGDCWNAGKRSRAISRDQARRALADEVKACPQCQPDTALGMLDQALRGLRAVFFARPSPVVFRIHAAMRPGV